MQNPVTPRNLRALDGRQLTLEAEFRDRFPGVTYELRPDVGSATPGDVIRNDDAAQLLCAVYNEQPWLAVKRQTLFSPEVYPQIFREEVKAEHIVLCNEIRRAVHGAKDHFPTIYKKSWALTALTAVYLVGQLLRTGDELRQILDEPELWLHDSESLERLRTVLSVLAGLAADELHARAESHRDEGTLDDYKVEFKRETSLRQLAASARSQYLGNPEGWLEADAEASK